MEGTRIVMVRHGESMAQERRIVGGHDGCTGLSERGRVQVTALRDRLARTGELGDDAVLYASLMPRAIETAQILAPALGDPPILRDCDLCEHHPGVGDGLTWDEFEARYPNPDGPWDPDYRRVPDSETWNEMKARVGRAIDGLVERHQGRTVVVATHGGPIVHAMIRFLCLDPATQEKRAWMGAENTSITEFRHAVNPYQRTTLDWELARYNDHAHLLGNGSGFVA